MPSLCHIARALQLLSSLPDHLHGCVPFSILSCSSIAHPAHCCHQGMSPPHAQIPGSRNLLRSIQLVLKLKLNWSQHITGHYYGSRLKCPDSWLKVLKTQCSGGYHMLQPGQQGTALLGGHLLDYRAQGYASSDALACVDQGVPLVQILLKATTHTKLDCSPLSLSASC